MVAARTALTAPFDGDERSHSKDLVATPDTRCLQVMEAAWMPHLDVATVLAMLAVLEGHATQAPMGSRLRASVQRLRDTFR